MIESRHETFRFYALFFAVFAVVTCLFEAAEHGWPMLIPVFGFLLALGHLVVEAWNDRRDRLRAIEEYELREYERRQI